MSTTVYTYNDKVLVNSANDKWLKKPEPPVDYVTIGTQTWKTSNIAVPMGTLNSDYVIRDGKYYYSFNSMVVRSYINYNYPGWHIPTSDEFNTLKTTVSDSASALAAAGFSVDEAVGAYYYEDSSWNYQSNSYQYLMGSRFYNQEEGYWIYPYFKTSSSTLTITSWTGEAWEDHLPSNLAMPIRLIQDSN